MLDEVFFVTSTEIVAASIAHKTTSRSNYIHQKISTCYKHAAQTRCFFAGRLLHHNEEVYDERSKNTKTNTRIN